MSAREDYYTRIDLYAQLISVCFYGDTTVTSLSVWVECEYRVVARLLASALIINQSFLSQLYAMKRVPLLLVGSIIAKHCNASNIEEKIRYPSSPKRKRLLLKGKESVDDIISSAGIIGEDVYNRDVKKQQRIDDAETLPLLEDGDMMLEVFDDSVEYLESFSYTYDDDNNYQDGFEVGSGSTFTTSPTPVYPTRPPSGVWDDDTYDTLPPLACEFCTNGLTVDADTELPTNDGATCGSFIALAATLIQSESICMSAQRMEEFCCPTTIVDTTSSVVEEEEEDTSAQTYDLCSCSPRTYTIKLSLTQLCNVNNLKDNAGIENTLCIANRQTIEEVENEEGTIQKIRRDNNMPSKHQLHKMTIIGIQFVEFSSEQLTGDLIVINQNDQYSNTTLYDGDTVSFDSISNELDPTLPLGEQLYLVPGGVQIAIRGMLEDKDGLIEEKIINQHVTWSYTNACDVEPIEADRSIGWVTVDSELTHASEDFCPVASTISPDSTTTTATTTEATPTLTTTSETPISTTEMPPMTTETPIPDYSMSMMGTKSGKAAAKTKAHKEESGMTKAHKQEKHTSKSSKLIQSKSSKTKSQKEDGVYSMEMIDAKAEKYSAQDLPQSKQSKKKASSVEEVVES